MYPSMLRRIVIIALYNVAIIVAVVVLTVILVTRICWFYNECTATDDVRLQWILVAWVVAGAASVVLGWLGRLWGVRRITPDG